MSLALLLALGPLWAPSAHAAFVHVATYGDDTSCGADNGTPCKTLQRAVTLASPGDTVYIEFIGDHGPATIAKALNIVAVNRGGIDAPAGVPCLTINAGVNDLVSITGLVCDQAGTTGDGILFNSGHRLRLVDVDFHGGGGGGGACAVRLRPDNNAEIDISNSNLTKWGRGVCLFPRAPADITGVLAGVTLQGNTTGISALAGAGSVISVICDACDISGGGTGVTSNGATSTVRIRNSVVSQNNLGLSHPNSGKIVSLRGNSLTGNTTKGTLTSAVPQL